MLQIFKSLQATLYYIHRMLLTLKDKRCLLGRILTFILIQVVLIIIHFHQLMLFVGRILLNEFF